jgi:hypothetical protein
MTRTSLRLDDGGRGDDVEREALPDAHDCR